MRDINRIDPFLEKFAILWKQNPDWRFGQLVINLQRVVSVNPDPFFTEDERMYDAIKYYLGEEEDDEMR